MLLAAFCEGKEVKLPKASPVFPLGFEPNFAVLLTVLEGRLGLRGEALPLNWGCGLARKPFWFMLNVLGNVVGFKGAVVACFGALCQSSPSRSSILDYWKCGLTIGQCEETSVGKFS